MRLACLLVLCLLLPAPLWAGEWFRHPFGEMRAYFGDWLAVCQDDGRGDCRAVQIVLRPGERRVGPARLAVERDSAGAYAISVFREDMPSETLAQVAFVFDGRPRVLDRQTWRSGDVSTTNVAETIAITDPALAADLVAGMKAGRWLEVRDATGVARFSLRGVTAALAAIEAHIEERDE